MDQEENYGIGNLIDATKRYAKKKKVL